MDLIRLLLEEQSDQVHTVCKNDFQNYKQMTKQTTILMIGSLRVNKNSAEGVIAPAGAKVTGATIRMWLLNKFISFLAVLTWKTGLKKM